MARQDAYRAKLRAQLDEHRAVAALVGARARRRLAEARLGTHRWVSAHRRQVSVALREVDDLRTRARDAWQAFRRR